MKEGHWPWPCPLRLYYRLDLEPSWKISIFGKTAALVKNCSGYTSDFTMKGKIKFCKDSCYCLVIKLCLTLVTPWTMDCKAPLSTEFFRQEHWSGLPFSTPDLPDPGIKPGRVCWVSCTGRQFLYHWATREAPARIASLWKIKSSLGARQFSIAKLITKLQLIKCTVLKSFCMHSSDLGDLGWGLKIFISNKLQMVLVLVVWAIHGKTRWQKATSAQGQFRGWSQANQWELAPSGKSTSVPLTNLHSLFLGLKLKAYHQNFNESPKVLLFKMLPSYHWKIYTHVCNTIQTIIPKGLFWKQTKLFPGYSWIGKNDKKWIWDGIRERSKDRKTMW